MLKELAASSAIDLLLVEGDAFLSGPWLHADDHRAAHLAEEIFEAGRLLRARGAQAWFIPSNNPTGTKHARVRSTFTAILDDIPLADLEENATQSALWSLLTQRVAITNAEGSAE